MIRAFTKILYSLEDYVKYYDTDNWRDELD